MEIRIDGHMADITPGASFPLEITNPNLSFDAFYSPVKVVLPVLPNTANNRSLINYFNFLQGGTNLTRHRVENYLNGHMIASGIFVLSEAGNEGFKGGVVENLGEFFGEYQDKLLSELNLGSIEIEFPLSPLTEIDDLPAFCFPKILNSDYYTGGVAYTGAMNDYTAGIYHADSPKVPQLFLGYVIKKIQDLTGATITGDFLTHPVLSNLLLFNLRNITAAGSYEIKTFLPELKLSEFFLEIRKFFNLEFKFDNFARGLEMNLYDQKLSQATEKNWSYKSVKGDRKLPEMNPRMSLIFTMDTADALVKDKPAQYADYLSPGDDQLGILPLTMKFSSICKDETTGLGKLQQAGIVTSNGQQDKKSSPRMIIWNGMVEDIPTATPEQGDIKLYPGDIADKFFANTISIRKDQFFLQKQMLLTEKDIAGIDFAKKIHINGLDYLLVQAKNDIPIKKPWDCVFLKV